MRNNLIEKIYTLADDLGEVVQEDLRNLSNNELLEIYVDLRILEKEFGDINEDY